MVRWDFLREQTSMVTLRKGTTAEAKQLGKKHTSTTVRHPTD